MTKTVPSTTRAPKPAEADTWVEEGAETAPARFTPPSGRTKRLTLDIDADDLEVLLGPPGGTQVPGHLLARKDTARILRHTG